MDSVPNWIVKLRMYIDEEEQKIEKGNRDNVISNERHRILAQL